MRPPLNSLQDQLLVTPAEDDHVTVTVTIPADLVQAFGQLLDSLATFFHVTRRKSALAQRVKVPPGAQSKVDAYRERLVSTFDAHLASGLDRKDALKRITAELQAENHPWRSIECVRSTLVAAGRGGRPGRPSKSSGDRT